MINSTDWHGITETLTGHFNPLFPDFTYLIHAQPFHHKERTPLVLALFDD